MLRPGLVSITFRSLSPAEVLDLCVAHGLQGVEWGGDVHVPAGDEAAAREVAMRTADAGRVVAAYGAYYRVGGADAGGEDNSKPGTPQQDWDATLATAVALGAPRVRVWCGPRGSAETDDATRAAVVADARRIAADAAEAGVRVVAEWHGGTLTDTTASAVRLLEEVDDPNFLTYWQPRTGDSFGEALDDLDAALPWLDGLHVFHWRPQAASESNPHGWPERRPLADGQGLWPNYIRQAVSGPRGTGGGDAPDAFALLEFVRDDDPANLPLDAEVLRQWTAWEAKHGGG